MARINTSSGGAREPNLPDMNQRGGTLDFWTKRQPDAVPFPELPVRQQTDFLFAGTEQVMFCGTQNPFRASKQLALTPGALNTSKVGV